MKKIFSFFLIFVVILFSFSFATEAAQPDNGANNTSSSSNNDTASILDNFNKDKVNSTITDVGDGAASFGKQILDQIVMWALPFCALAIVWGAVCYFVLGIRNLYKKRQGMLLMWGSLTMYVVIVFADLIVNFLAG
ncbi:MAG: hypothetical protein IJS47_04070 [Clostridia bacterium]|nr:hypothetical protein [Clostridia bacterium]